MDMTPNIENHLNPEFFRFVGIMGENPLAFQRMMDMIPYGLCLSDAGGRIFYWNPEVERMTGIAGYQALGKSCHALFSDCHAEPSPSETPPDGGAAGLSCEEVTVDVMGRTAHLKKSASPIYDAEGRLQYTMGIFVDMTRQYEAEAAMQEGRELAESARNAKRHFMANMTHEIRTPLNGIMGLLDLMLSEDPTPALQEYLDSAKRSTRLLLDLVDNILDFPIIDKGAVNIEYTGFSLASIIGSVIARQYALIHNKQVGIHSLVEDDVPDNLLGDSGRLYQLLKHLVGNAIKFAPAGEVAVRVARVPDAAGDAKNRSRQTMLHFSISDTGVGIPEEKLDTIFESLSQVDDSDTRAVGGLGIGLNIAQRLVVLLGGRIWMESEVGRGTIVHFILPFKSASTRKVERSTGSRREPSKTAPSAKGETIFASSNGTIKVDNYLGPKDRTLSLAAKPLPPQWFAKFETASELLTHDKPAAEAVLTELRAGAEEARQRSTATLLLRLLLALRRDDRAAMTHFYSIIDRKIKSGTGAGDAHEIRRRNP